MSGTLRKSFIILMVLILNVNYLSGQCKIDYSNWQLVLNEDFSEYSLDRPTQIAQLEAQNTWLFNMEFNPTYGYSEYYPNMHDPSNVWIMPDGAGGHFCRLKAIRVPSYISDDSIYQSGMLYLKQGFETSLGYGPEDNCPCPDCPSGFVYGMYEIVCKTPKGNPGYSDTWPAFWGHGPSGEIDIIDDLLNDPSVEWKSGYIDPASCPGEGVDPEDNPWTLVSSVFSSESAATSSCRCPIYSFSNSYATTSKVVASVPGGGFGVYQCSRGATKWGAGGDYKLHMPEEYNLSDNYNTYTCVWEPNKISFFLNGREQYTRPLDEGDLYDRLYIHCQINVIANLQTGKNLWTRSNFYHAPDSFVMDIKRISVYKGIGGDGGGGGTFNDYATYMSLQNYMNYKIAGEPMRPNYGLFAADVADGTYYYQGVDGKIYSVNPLSGSLSASLVNFPSGGSANPNGDLCYEPDNGIIVYKDHSNNIWYLRNTHSGPAPWRITNFTSSYIQVSSTPGSIKTNGGVVVFKGADNKIHILYKYLGSWYHEILGDYPSSSDYVKDDICVDADYGNIYFKGADDQAHDLWRDGAGVYHNLILSPYYYGTSWQIADEPGTMFLNPHDNNIYFVRKADYHIYYFYWDGSMGFVPAEIPYTYTGSNDEPRGDIAWDGNTGVVYSGYDGKIQRFDQSSGVWEHSWINDYFTTDFNAQTCSGGGICSTWFPNVTAGQFTAFDKPIVFYNNAHDSLSFFEYCNCSGSIAESIPNTVSENYANILRKAAPNSSDSSMIAANVTGITVFPNPSNTGVFNVRLQQIEKAEMTVFDLRGNVIIANSIDNLSNTIDLTNQPNGMYILEATTSGATIRTKIMIDRR